MKPDLSKLRRRELLKELRKHKPLATGRPKEYPRCKCEKYTLARAKKRGHLC